MLLIVAANILDIIDNSVYAYSSTRKTKENIMRVQCISATVGILSKLCLGSFVGVGIGLTSLIRNHLISKGLFNRLSFFLVLATNITTALIINEGILGIIATTATISYTVMLYKSTDNTITHLALIFNSLLWSIYNFGILAITAGIFNLLTLAGATISIARNSTTNPKGASHD